MVSAIELSESIGVIVLRETGEKSNPVTRSTNLSVAEATRLNVLPEISIRQACGLTPSDIRYDIGKPADIWR